MSGASSAEQKPATAARIYDYHLGGTHNFDADRQAAKAIVEMFPLVPAITRANRVFLQRAVRQLAGAGVRQFLDIGSGIPTEGNVHEIAPDASVVYVDLDPVAVAESLEILENVERATAIRGDLKAPQAILDHPEVRGLLDFDQPIGILLVAVLHFVADDAAYDAVGQLLAAAAPGSYLVISHGTAQDSTFERDEIKVAEDIYKQRTATQLRLRDRAEISRFFAGLELVEPGVVWMSQWKPEPDDPQEFADDPSRSGIFVAVGRK